LLDFGTVPEHPFIPLVIYCANVASQSWAINYPAFYFLSCTILYLSVLFQVHALLALSSSDFLVFGCPLLSILLVACLSSFFLNYTILLH